MDYVQRRSDPAGTVSVPAKLVGCYVLWFRYVQVLEKPILIVLYTPVNSVRTLQLQRFVQHCYLCSSIFFWPNESRVYSLQDAQVRHTIYVYSFRTSGKAHVGKDYNEDMLGQDGTELWIPLLVVPRQFPEVWLSQTRSV